MLNFRLLTSQTRIHKLSHISLQTRPPEQLLQIMIHFFSSWMNTQATSVTFLKNHLLHLIVSRYTDSVSKPQHSLSINFEITILSLIHQIHQLHIYFLSFSDTTQKFIVDLQHTQHYPLRCQFTNQTHISELFKQLKFPNHQSRHMKSFPAQSISNNVSFTWMIIQSKVIIFQQFKPSSLPHIQLFLIKQILQTLMITKHLKSRSIQIMPPDFQHKYYSSQLKIMSRIIPFMNFQLFRCI